MSNWEKIWVARFSPIFPSSEIRAPIMSNFPKICWRILKYSFRIQSSRKKDCKETFWCQQSHGSKVNRLHNYIAVSAFWNLKVMYFVLHQSVAKYQNLSCRFCYNSNTIDSLASSLFELQQQQIILCFCYKFGHRLMQRLFFVRSTYFVTN